VTVGFALPVSGKNVVSTPHDPLFANRLPVMMLLRSPARTSPPPTGPIAASPIAGTFGLLLSWT
jgi:hypothetical protein